MFRRNYIDLTLLIAVLTLMFMSIAVVYSASASWALKRHGSTEYLMISHAGKVALGLLALFVGINFDYRKMRYLTKPVIFLAVGLLLATLIAGVVAKGASRWLLGFQPSELAKFALIFHLSTLLAIKGDDIRDFKKGFMPLMFWILTVTGLVMLQPNFSMGAIIFGLGMLMLFLGRAKITHLASTFVVMIPGLLLYMWSAPYRQKRILDFLSGGSTGKTSWQLLQSLLAFGNGGFFGVGAGDSRQREFFLPESFGDFVYAIIGEEYGLLGTLVVLTLFVIILVRGYRIARAAEDTLGRYLALGITTAIALFAAVNAGVTVGVLPTTGLPMPFVSYGGSSILFSAFAVGILLNISSQTDLYPRPNKNKVVKHVVNDEPNLGKVY